MRLTRIFFSFLLVFVFSLFFVPQSFSAFVETVTNTNDSGPGSLRQAIADVDPGGTVNFNIPGPGLKNIILAAPNFLHVNKPMTINGPGKELVRILSNQDVFRIQDADTHARFSVTISGLTISQGSGNLSTKGILNFEDLVVNDCDIRSFATGIEVAGPGFQVVDGRAGTLELNNSTISFTQTAILLHPGDALSPEAGVATINHSTIRNNARGVFVLGGEGGDGSGGNVTINNSTLSRNHETHIIGTSGTSDNAEGAVININNSTLTDSFGGSGVELRGVSDRNANNNTGSATAAVNHSTITGNTNGIEMYFLSSGISRSEAILDIKNSIVADNDIDCNITDGDFAAFGDNLDTDGTCSAESAQFTQVTLNDINLGPLQNNGGVTETRALIQPSAAIDTAFDCTFLDGGPVTADQRIFVFRPQGAACDIGAFESNAPVVTPPFTSLGVNPGVANSGNTIDFQGTDPNERIIIIWGFNPLFDQIRSGSCAGAFADIKNPRIFRTRPADSNGDLNVPVFIPRSLAGLTIIVQGVKEDTCESSNAETVTFQ